MINRVLKHSLKLYGTKIKTTCICRVTINAYNFHFRDAGSISGADLSVTVGK